MGENLLSLLHIQKLGHPLEEIRIRALSSIISKYNLNLVDEEDVENTHLLLQKLLDWFNFENYSEEKKVLVLILKILKSDKTHEIFPYTAASNLLKRLEAAEKKCSGKHSSVIKEIREELKKVENKFVESQNVILNGFTSNKQKVDGLELKNSKEIISAICLEGTDDNNCPEVVSGKSVKFDTNELKVKKSGCVKIENTVKQNNFIIEFFPWQNLVLSNQQIISSVFDKLKYLDDTNSIFQACQFFSEVVLRDFPAEIFIQRPLIIRTLLQLILTLKDNTKLPVLKCLKKIIECLNHRVQLNLSSLFFNKKNEYYTVMFYPTDSNGDEALEKKISKHFHLKFPRISEEFDSINESSYNDKKLKMYQLSLPQFCFEVLFQLLPLLKIISCPEETNHIMELNCKTINFLISTFKPGILNNEKGLISKFYRLFGIIQELLKHYRNHDKIIYVILLKTTVQILNSFKLPTEMMLNEILPRGLHLELGFCILDSSIYIMFSNLHCEILQLVKKFIGQQEKEILQDYRDVRIILDSMKSAIVFLKFQNELKSKLDKLKCVHRAVKSLDFHQNLTFIHDFVVSCLIKWSKSDMSEEELNLREDILLKLLSHSNNSIKIHIYKEINDCVVKLLGGEKIVALNCLYPGDKMEFLFEVNVLTEIICHGVPSNIPEVEKYSSNILIVLLKSKFLLSENGWNDFIKALRPCLSLLQCFADKSTTLGRCIIKMFDPDVAKSSGLPQIEVLKGNIRLLFSKHSLSRDEAMPRLFWLLNKEDAENRKLPKMSVLTGLNLSGICVSVKPIDYTDNRQLFYNPGKLWDVMEMLNSENLEPNIRRSALSQLNAMLDDVSLHSIFLEQNGLKKILKILDSSLVEREYRNYPDSVIPIIDILRHISLHNAATCLELSSSISTLYNILRSLFLFSSDDRLRRNAVELLCLLLYCDIIIRVPAEESSKRILSFPEIVVAQMSLPFTIHSHWKNSRHLEPSIKRSILSKESCSKLIRIYWNSQWIGSLSDFLTTEPSHLTERTYYPGIPDDLKITYNDIKELKKCSFVLSVKQTLCDIQNATSHDAVRTCIHKLQSYFLLYNVEKSASEKNANDMASDTVLSHMLWESTLERFLISIPACSLDESLLLQIVQFIRLVIKSFRSERLISWIEKFLIDLHKPFFKILKDLENGTSGLKVSELPISIIKLTQEVVSLKSSIDSKKWFPYMELISAHLKLKEIHNAAYVDWLMGLLVDLTGKCSFAHKEEFLKTLIIRIIEVVIAFHCTQDSIITFMGMSIIKNSLLALNHILSDTQSVIEKWEDMWLQALSKVIGHSEYCDYSWLLSFWVLRDTIARAAGYQLFAGFTATQKGCALLLDHLNLPFTHVWAHSFKTLFDFKESCIVREKCGLLISNLVMHGSKWISGTVNNNLLHYNFYANTFSVMDSFQSQPSLSELVLDNRNNIFEGDYITTPSLFTSISILLLNVVFTDPIVICEQIMENNLLKCLFRVLGEVPEFISSCENHEYYMDIIQMCISICRLIKKCITTISSSHLFILQSQFALNAIFSMINYNLYCRTSEEISALKIDLWCEIFDIFSAVLKEIPKDQDCGIAEDCGFVAINRCMTENGVDYFVSSICIALTSDCCLLKVAVLQFLRNLFHNEIAFGKSDVSIKDIFERKIPDEVINLSKIPDLKENIISNVTSFNFGIRLADILLQMFLLNIDNLKQNVKSPIADVLGSLLAIFRPAQNYCLKQNLSVSLILCLKQICVKLSIESATSLKKLSEKKRIEPMLQNLEILFQLINNFIYNNESAKNDIAIRDFSVIVHKLWPWCVTQPSLYIVTLKMLCTFTHDCNQGCRSLVSSSNFTVMSFKKIPGSVTLINAVFNQITMEMNFTSKSSQCETVGLSLELLTNCCSVSDCRSVMAKSNILQCFTQLYSKQKKRPSGETIIESWLIFLIAFSSHQEGQLALAKNKEILDVLIGMVTTSKSTHRLNVLVILRNICFHQPNRYRMLSHGSFLTILLDTLNSNKREEVQQAIYTVWALACNSQKNKMILRSAGFEVKLESVKRNCVLADDAETNDLISVVLDILKSK